MWISKRNLAFSEQADEKDEQLIELVYYIPDDIDQPDFISTPGKGSVTKINDGKIEIYFEDNRSNTLTIVYEWDGSIWVMKDSSYTEDVDDHDEYRDRIDEDSDEFNENHEYDDEDYEE